MALVIVQIGNDIVLVLVGGSTSTCVIRGNLGQRSLEQGGTA